MTNENNNNELVESDDDPTSELEAVTWRRDDVVVASDSLEVSAGTIGFGQSERGQDSVSDEQQALEHLSFELEQQRALRKGLEAEVRARAEITDTLNAQVADLHVALGRKKLALEKKSKAVKSLKREIRERNKAFKVATAELATVKHALADIESEHAATREDLDAKVGSITDLEQQNARDSENLAELLQVKETLADELEVALGSIETLQVDLHEAQRVVSSRDDEIERLQAATDSARNKSTEDSVPKALLASRERELFDYITRIENLESHTDGIRQGLQDAMADNAQLAAENAAFRQSTSDQSERIRALSAELNSANLAIADLERAQDDLVNAHEQELRTVRFELGEAQTTMSQNELINEQLASDLIQTRGFKESLEHMLEQNDEKAQAKISELEKQLHKMRKDNLYFEEQLHTKNEAINCLLAELAAKRSRDDEAKREVELPPTPLPDEEAFQADVDFRLPDSDRVSRFLIGEIDGQEVQYPLFKGRLTIGRAQANDIQLTADYISRRHAVLVTEQDITRIIDWGSRNGVRVNGRAVTEHFLTSGDSVRIGTFDFLYEERKRPDKT